MQIVELGDLTGFARVWSAFEFWMVGECVEFEGIFSLCLVFLREMVGSVGRQSFDGDDESLIRWFFEWIFGVLVERGMSGTEGRMR